jgi:hypothetical protein
MAAGAALAAKRGEGKKSSLKGASRKMVESMSKRTRDFAKRSRNFHQEIFQVLKAKFRQASPNDIKPPTECFWKKGC